MDAPRIRQQQAESANALCYDTYYDKPEWWFRFRYDTQIKKRTCQWLVRKGGKKTHSLRVCELGFGSGAFLFSFPKDCEVCGLEISNSAIIRAQNLSRRQGFKASEFHRVVNGPFPVQDRVVDVFAASHVLEHVGDDKFTLREIHRVLHDDGIAVIIVPINERYADPNHIRHYDACTLAAAAKEAGFEICASIENETLFYLVERFYFEQFNVRWRVVGPLIAALFNGTTSLIPFWACRLIDRLFTKCGRPPRQAGVVLRKAKDLSPGR